MKKGIIIEKQLGIPANYQYQALRSKNFLQSNWHYNKLVVLEKIIKMTGARTVLDLGTGSGNFELRFAKSLERITGVDYNDQALGFLRKKLKQRNIRNVKLIQKDLRDISENTISEKFDLIVATDVIEHLKISDAKKFISTTKAFLAPNGTVCIITPNYRSPWLLIERVLDKFTIFPHMENEQHLAKFHKENLENVFKSAGFVPFFFSTFNLFSYFFFNKVISGTLCKMEFALKLPFGNLLVSLFKRR